VQASIDAVSGVHDSETGWYGTLHYTGCETRERAKEISDALFRCAYYMHTHKGPSVGMNTKIARADDGTYTVEFRATDKAFARAAVVAKYGEDRSKWPYDPRKKNK
jgi:hypothetical protein